MRRTLHQRDSVFSDFSGAEARAASKRCRFFSFGTFELRLLPSGFESRRDILCKIATRIISPSPERSDGGGGAAEDANGYRAPAPVCFLCRTANGYRRKAQTRGAMGGRGCASQAQHLKNQEMRRVLHQRAIGFSSCFILEKSRNKGRAASNRFRFFGFFRCLRARKIQK